MTKRARGNHEGSVYQEGTGRRRWVAQVKHGGKTVRRFAATEAEAKRRLRELVAAAATGAPVASGNLTVAAVLADFLKGEVAERSLSISTTERYHWAVAKLNPLIGSKRAARLSPRDVEAALRALRDAGLSRDSLAKIRGVLVQALDRAVLLDELPRNVAKVVKTPKVEARATSGRSMTAVEARRFLKACEGRTWGAMFTAALVLGLRPGEAAALRWQDVDEDAGTVTVSHTRRKPRKGEVALAPPKTERSARTVAAPSIVLTALAERRALQVAEHEHLGRHWHNEHGLIFTTPWGTPTDPRRVAEAFAEIMDAAGLGDGWTPNHLRHSCASLAADAGVPMAALADQLGHTTTRMLDAVYRHRLAPVQRAGDTVAAVLA